MPKVPINYQNGLIYKLVCKDLEIKDLYIGSTTNFTKRKNSHSSNCKRQGATSRPVHKFINDNGGWDNWDMILIKYFPCNTRLELEAGERKQIELLGATLNKHIPTRTIKEWGKKYRNENKEQIAIRGKKYRDENVEKLKLKSTQYREQNKEAIRKRQSEIVVCECGMKSTKGVIPRHRKSKKHQEILNCK